MVNLFYRHSARAWIVKCPALAFQNWYPNEQAAENAASNLQRMTGGLVNRS